MARTELLTTFAAAGKHAPAARTVLSGKEVMLMKLPLLRAAYDMPILVPGQHVYAPTVQVRWKCVALASV